MNRLLTALACFLFLGTTPLFAQEGSQQPEVNAVVKALDGFHEIIRPIWHKAYPAKDIAALKAYVPQIKTALEAVNLAVLPETLKAKEADWKKQLLEFNKAADAYYVAASGTDDEALLKAASELHSQYEMTQDLVR